MLTGSITACPLMRLQHRTESESTPQVFASQASHCMQARLISAGSFPAVARRSPLMAASRHTLVQSSPLKPSSRPASLGKSVSAATSTSCAHGPCFTPACHVEGVWGPCTSPTRALAPRMHGVPMPMRCHRLLYVIGCHSGRMSVKVRGGP
jgi:hypothetical protein